MCRLVMVLVLICVALPEAPALAQPSTGGSRYVSKITGDAVDLGDSGSIAFAPEYEELIESEVHREEYLGFTTWWSVYVIGFIEGPITVFDLRQATTATMRQGFDSFEILAESQTADHSWFLASLESDGTNLRVYYEHQLNAFGDVGFVFIQYSDEANMVNDFSFVQQEVTVNESPILEHTDPQRLVTALAGQSETVGNDSDASLLETMLQTESNENRDADVLSTLISGSQNDEPEAPPYEEWQDEGLVSESEWVSPLYGTSIGWNPAVWQFPYEYPHAYRTYDDPPYDGISLVSVADGVWVDFNVHNTGSYLTRQSYLDWWLTAEYASDYTGGFEILDSKLTDSTVAVVAQVSDRQGRPMLLVMTASFLPDGKVVQSQLYVYPGQLAPAYGQLVSSITVNGSPLEFAWSTQELEAMPID